MSPRSAIAVVIVAALVLVAASWTWSPAATTAELGIAWLWAMGLSLGALLLDQILLCCGATWQLPMLRLLETVHAAVPWLGGIGLVVLVIATWHGAGQGPAPAAVWLWLRMLGYLSIAALTSGALRWLSVRGELSGDARWARRRRLVGCGALIPVALAACIAVMDGYAQCDGFASSIFAPLLVVSGMLAGLAAWTALVAHRLARGLLPIHADHLVATGRLLLALVIVATYLAFAQLIICWMGDLPDEATWYRPRLHGYLGWFGLVVLGFGYALPFGALLSHDLKTRPLALILVCASILLGQFGMDWWTMMPVLRGAGVRIGPEAIVAVMLMTGLGLWWCSSAWSLTSPRQTPELLRALAYRERLE